MNPCTNSGVTNTSQNDISNMKNFTVKNFRLTHDVKHTNMYVEVIFTVSDVEYRGYLYNK